MPTLISNSEEDTKKIAEDLAKNITSGVIALSGQLGAGKTIFVQGFAKGLGIKDRIISPTFVLIRQHLIPPKQKVLYHIDLYRLENKSSLKELGLKEIINDSNNLVLIEWAEKISKLLPGKTIKINILKEIDDKRIIQIS